IVAQFVPASGESEEKAILLAETPDRHRLAVSTMHSQYVDIYQRRKQECRLALPPGSLHNLGFAENGRVVYALLKGKGPQSDHELLYCWEVPSGHRLCQISKKMDTEKTILS